MLFNGKNFVPVLLAALTLTSSAFAGDREWATVGKVLTGVAAIRVIDRIVTPPQPVVVYAQPVVVYQPVVTPVAVVVASPPTVVYVQPAPVVYYQPAPVIYYQPSPVIYYQPSPVFFNHPHHFHRGWR
jgi:hypothetical protein